MIYRIVRSGIGNNDIGMMLIQLVAFLGAIYFAIVLHEVAHGMVAKWNGDPTAQVNGRLTLNPIRHIDVRGLIMLLLVGIGWAKPVPINPNNFYDRKKGMFYVSIAGIVTNISLCAVSLGLLAALAAIGKATQVIVGSVAYYFLKLILLFFVYSAVINASLAGFNLLPLFPLDGFRIIESFTNPNNKFMAFCRRYGIYFLYALILLSVLADFTGWNCDVLGMYIGVIQKGVEKLVEVIWGV